jgi:hypothetical protein
MWEADGGSGDEAGAPGRLADESAGQELTADRFVREESWYAANIDPRHRA